jgi:hypothetical protein
LRLPFGQAETVYRNHSYDPWKKYSRSLPERERPQKHQADPDHPGSDEEQHDTPLVERNIFKRAKQTGDPNENSQEPGKKMYSPWRKHSRSPT